VVVDGAEVALSPEEVIVTETPREGWSVASDAGATVALDLEITPELRLAGLARDVIRLVQDARKTSGFDVADRIHLRYAASGGELAEALEVHSGLVAEEVLAESLRAGAPEEGFGDAFSDESLGLTFHLRKA
jgi:isoleucyl-tRNA synthetase